MVGFSLGLIGGGGSILAVPLLVYLVGVEQPHLAIGTAAFAVAANAFGNLLQHARGGHVAWPHAGWFSAAGVVGAWAGSSLGKATDGQALLGLFALLILLVAALMFRHRRSGGSTVIALDPSSGGRLALAGAVTGAVAGFFGIGGGFLIVPALTLAARLPILVAVGSSLLAVTSFGLTTAINYARAGWVDWPLAACLIVGGLAGGRLGILLARRWSLRHGRLNLVFSGVLVLVALYMLWRSAPGWWPLLRASLL